MEDSLKTLELRAHHLLCILGFRGLGYSRSFIENMEKVIKDICSNFYRGIKIMDKCDIICSVCLYCKNNECRKEEGSEQKAKKRDSEVIRRIGAKLEEEFPPEELWTLVAKKIAPTDIPTICRDCEWLNLNYCVDGLSKLRVARNKK